MVTDGRVKELRRLLRMGRTLADSARMAEMREKSTRKYRDDDGRPSQKKTARTYRTRTDPFEDVRGEVQGRLETEPRLKAKTLFEWLQETRAGVSYPAGEFFVMTHGAVSRCVTTSRDRSRRQDNPKASEHWMEITAPFVAGSSGCGVFNEKGEVVRLVSRLHPLMRDTPPNAMDAKSPIASFVEMLVRRCVPLAAIRDGFERKT